MGRRNSSMGAGLDDRGRRVAVFCGVFACHIVCLMIALYSPRRVESQIHAQKNNDVLRLTFDPPPKTRHLASTAMNGRIAVKSKPVQPSAMRKVAVSAVTTTTGPAVLSTASPVTAIAMPMTDDLDQGYQPGDFQATLQNAQRASVSHLPGSALPLVAGIEFQDATSPKKTASGLAERLRCGNLQARMQRDPNPLTPQLMDRALQLEGCGRHLEPAPNDAAIDAIAHSTVFGR